MVSYAGKHAEYYDIFYKDKPYAQEAAFVDRLLTQHANPKPVRLLELACGSGRHALELEKLGYSIVATDYSPDLLEVAKRSGAKAGSGIEFRLQDMRDLVPPHNPFDAAYCLFDSIGYVQGNQALNRVFAGVHGQLKPQGLFVFEFWHAAAMLRKYDSVREKVWSLNGRKITRISRTKLDVIKQTAQVDYSITEEVGSNVIRVEESQTNRYFLVQEMSHFLESNRFEPVSWHSAYDDAEINEDTWHILAVARRS
jgi:SAM-dependent methyltransferase